MARTFISLHKADGKIERRMELFDSDPSTYGIAEAAVALIQSVMSLSVGDMIKVTEEEDK